MKKLLTVLFAFAIVMCCSCGVAFAQSKGETKLYKSSISKGTLKAYNKFLSKYPSSVYAPKVRHIVDSIHYSAVNQDEIASYLKFMADYPHSDFLDDAFEHVKTKALKDRYVQNEELSEYRIVEDGFTDAAVDTGRYYLYAYENFSASVPDAVEYVYNLLDKKSGAVFSAMFSGKKKPSGNMIGYIIEGESMDEETNRSFKTAEMTYLLKMIDSKDFLVKISKADIMTDQAIEWWIKENPYKSRKLYFGLLPAESSIVEAFRKAGEYETSGGYKVALFDIRGYTVICAYQKSSSQYILVWCEPVCKNKKKDQLLNTIYFENTNSLVLYYYKGKTTFKVRVNMATKAVTY